MPNALCWAMAKGLEICVGRIERLNIEAIVNAANSALVPGAGVDGAIRAAAGEDLDKLLTGASPLEVGAALVTPGFRAPARWIVHTVAPHWADRASETAKEILLRQCYLSCLEAAADLAMHEIAFPALGTGAYAWPKARAAPIAINAVRDGVARFGAIQRVVFCCFTEDDAAFYRPHLV